MQHPHRTCVSVRHLPPPVRRISVRPASAQRRAFSSGPAFRMMRQHGCWTVLAVVPAHIRSGGPARRKKFAALPSLPAAPPWFVSTEKPEVAPGTTIRHADRFAAAVTAASSRWRPAARPASAVPGAAAAAAANCACPPARCSSTRHGLRLDSSPDADADEALPAESAAL